MKSILIVSNVSGGLFSFRRELVEALAKENKVTILASDTGHVDDFRSMGCEVIVTSFERHGTNPFVEIKTVSFYKKILKEKKPDIVLTYTIKPNIYVGMACASLGIPYVANITGLGPAIDNGGLLEKISVALYRFGLRKAQKVFFQNESDMRYMVSRHTVTGAYELIPGSGVNLERYTVLDYPDNDTIDFVFIGRIIPEKGIWQYLDAAKAILKKYPQTRFHICGSCGEAYREKLNSYLVDERIVYHGRVSDIGAIHAFSCCTVHPTYYPEGMSNVLLESCACGRPIITTDRPGCREIVDDGVNGFVVKQKDSADLIEKIEKFLALTWEQRRDMGLAGRAKVEREFDRNIVVQKYLEEIERAGL